MDRSPATPPGMRVRTRFDAHCRFSQVRPCWGAPRKGAAHAKRRPFVSTSLEPQTRQRGQKPFGVAKNSKTETFRRCRI